MSIEAVLKTNLNALMSAHPELNSQLKLSRVSKVGQTTVGRIRRADGAATIDNVEKIAKAFKLTVPQLLDPRLPAQLSISGDLDSKAKAAALAAEIQEANLSDTQLTILANTLAALRSS